MARGVVACMAAILSIGGSAVIAQTLLLRELLFQFAGSELYIGLIIGNWIAAEALGAFIAGRFMKDPARALARYSRLTILFSSLFPALLFLARSWRSAAGLPVHEAVSLWQTLSVSILLIFPLAMIHGAQFILATSIYAEITGRGTDSPGKVYGLETIGTIIGGATAAFILVPLIPPFQIAAILLFMNGIIVFSLQKTVQQSLKPAGLAMLLFPLLASLVLACGGTAALESASLRLQWRGDALVASRNSAYQNIAVIRNGEQHTVYLDGAPLVSLPDQDIAKNEESAHLPLLVHPRPREILLLGGGASGIIGEILKHPSVERIDYLELDPLLIKTIERYAPEKILAELRDPRVTIRSQDGRAFLRDTAERYDVIMAGMPLPQNLQGNRYFTAEFVAAVKSVLKPDGVMTVSAAGSMNYYGADLKEMTRSLLCTLKSGFPHILVVPGDRNLFIASATLPVEAGSAAELADRLETRAIKTALISASHLDWLLDDKPLQWFKQTVGAGGTVNSDFSPYLLTRHLSYLTAQLSPELKPLLAWFGGMKTAYVAAVFLLLTVSIGLLAKGTRPVVLWTIATSGFSAMLLELSFFFIFQLFQGVMLQTISLLIAVFMAGICGGSRASAHAPALPSHDRRRLFAGDAILLLLSAALLAISAGVILPASSSTASIYLVLLPLIFFAGFAAGFQFPPATRLASAGSGSGTALVYGFDLLGGWLGGVVGGALLLPLLGFAHVAILLCILKSGSILCLYLQRKSDKM